MVKVAVVHVANLLVRRSCLLGDNPVTGENYDHREQWINDRMTLQAKYFGIDLLCKGAMPSRSVGMPIDGWWYSAMDPPHRKLRKVYDHEGDAHFLAFSCFRRLPLLSNE